MSALHGIPPMAPRPRPGAPPPPEASLSARPLSAPAQLRSARLGPPRPASADPSLGPLTRPHRPSVSTQVRVRAPRTPRGARHCCSRASSSAARATRSSSRCSSTRSKARRPRCPWAMGAWSDGGALARWARLPRRRVPVAFESVEPYEGWTAWVGLADNPGCVGSP